MKLQHIAIIFVIIVVPISLVLSMYLSTQIKTIESQTKYDNILINATYDGIKAFQLNTANNMYSTISDSKIRDIEASINVFYSSLATNLGSSGYSQNELKSYVPAILFTLYDGYYIYSNYYDTTTDSYKFGLKPFIYYSCRYVKGNSDFVVNYTLDNTITIIGTVNNEYVVKTGHLLANGNEVFENEILTENLIILGDNVDIDSVTPETFDYTVYNSQKIYLDKDATINNQNDTGSEGRKRYFYYSSDYKKDYVTDPTTIEYLNGYLSQENGVWRLHNDSAKQYYDESLTNTSDDGKTFTQWVTDNLGDITQECAVDVDGNSITDFATELGTSKIFEISEDNNPLNSSSAFNEHRRNVIRHSIETNLVSAVETFSNHTVVGYEFAVQQLGEDEWEKLENNVCMLAFLEGISMGTKIYSNYCVVSNNTNQETVGNDSIYIIDDQGVYHKPGCTHLIEDLNSGSLSIQGAYSSSEFERKTVSITGEDSNAHTQLDETNGNQYAYYYPESYTPCYYCIVSASQTYSTDEIIKSNTITNLAGNSIDITNLRKVYLTALARSRYNLYLTNNYFGY